MKLRSIAALLCLWVCSSSLPAQNTLTTYYVIPPTNGCDGTWAFGPYSALWSTCTGPYTYLFDPMTCVDGSQWGQPIPLNVVGDTIIMDLCSQPCDFLFYADTGLCLVCICGPLISTGVSGQPSEGALSIGPNPVPSGSSVIVLRATSLGPHHVQVLDVAGREMIARTLNGPRSELDLSGIPPGGYLLLVKDDAGRLSVQRFQIQ